MTIMDRFDELTEESIEEFIRERQEENLHLEFKTIGDPGLDREDRKNLAQCVSGFANSDGGLIVWGVDARRNADGVDCAVGRRHIADLPLLLARLNQYSGEAASPVVDGVRHRQIPGRENAAVTLVPASAAGPHMAKLGEDRYFKRSGDRFVRMEHFDLEDMFGRRQRPILALTHRVARGGEPAGAQYWRFRIILGISDSGRGAARAPYLAFDLVHPWFRYSYGVDGNGKEGLPRLAKASDSTWETFGGPANLVIHPGTALDITAIACVLSGPTEPPPRLELSYRLAADGVRLQEGVLILEPEELIRLSELATVG